MSPWNTLLRGIPTEAVLGVRNLAEWLLNNAAYQSRLEPDELRRLLADAVAELDRRKQPGQP